MMGIQFWVSVVWILGVFATANSSPTNHRQVLGYAPIRSSCPTNKLVRTANKRISEAEASYISARKVLADKALEKWLKKVDSSFSSKKLPSIGLASSGGGFRSLLQGAGIIHSFDSRDGNFGTSGLYQALSYHAGLSGGAWLVATLSANGWPTVSSLKTDLWEKEFAAFPSEEDRAVLLTFAAAKNGAGFIPTLTDLLGLLLDHGMFKGKDSGASVTFSSLVSQPEFKGHNGPYPIITAAEVVPDECFSEKFGRIFEISPYEFGSWDKGIEAFTSTKYLGTNYTGGKPTKLNNTNGCVQNFDNLGYFVGTTSNGFNNNCKDLPSVTSNDFLTSLLEGLLSTLHPASFRDEFAAITNPFYQYPPASGVNLQTELMLIDGIGAGENNPIWPFIQVARNATIDVLIVNDNTADDVENWPNGSQIYNTFVHAKEEGLSRMPTIPPPSTFISQGLNKRATFFGCTSKETLSIVYLPNVMYSYATNHSATQPAYTVQETNDMIANGVKIGTQNNDSQWPMCLACIIIKKAADELPKGCVQCFEKYCYKD